MQRWLIKVPFTAIFRPGIIIKLMVVEDGGRMVGTSWVLSHSGNSFIHRSPVHHSSGHRPAGGEPAGKTAGYLKEWIRAWFKRYSSSSFWRVLEGPWESAQEVLVCFVETLSLVWLWEKEFWTESGLSFLLPQAQQFKDWQTELSNISIWKLVLAFYGGDDLVSQSVSQLPKTVGPRGAGDDWGGRLKVADTSWLFLGSEPQREWDVRRPPERSSDFHSQDI